MYQKNAKANANAVPMSQRFPQNPPVAPSYGMGYLGNANWEMNWEMAPATGQWEGKWEIGRECGNFGEIDEKLENES